ncbi:MAG: hypothetical protein JWO57_69 [Pseudonocardiales bacterium]|nr:hypothetical protein [Pseudonocardiales bacterium]
MRSSSPPNDSWSVQFPPVLARLPPVSASIAPVEWCPGVVGVVVGVVGVVGVGVGVVGVVVGVVGVVGVGVVGVGVGVGGTFGTVCSVHRGFDGTQVGGGVDPAGTTKLSNTWSPVSGVLTVTS